MMFAHFDQVLNQVQVCCRDQVAFQQMKQMVVSDWQQRRRDQVLLRISTLLQEPVDLATVLSSVATEVRQELAADRVVLVRLDAQRNQHADSSDGQWVCTSLAEAVASGVTSILNASLQPFCFSTSALEPAKPEQMQVIADIYRSGLPANSIQQLERWQVRASLRAPLFQGKTLWGWLWIQQCTAPRAWQADELAWVTQVGLHVRLALQQATLLSQLQQRSQALNEALEQLSRSQIQLRQQESLSSLGQLVGGVAQDMSHPVNFLCSNLVHAQNYAETLLRLIERHQQQPVPEAELNHSLVEMNLDFLKQDFPKLLASLRLGAERLRQLVQSLQSAACAEPSKLQRIDLHDRLDSTLVLLNHRLQPTPEFQGIKVIKEYGQLPALVGYSSELDELIRTLLSRAIETLRAFHRQGWALPQLILRSRFIPDPYGSSPRVVLCIADNRPVSSGGEEIEAADAMMDRCRRIVEQHGGELQCYAQPDGGTEVWIELPVSTAELVEPSCDAGENRNQPHLRPLVVTR
ncbi:MAG: GAF domain-containing sensor histidine kinase [Synechococcales cyanobacterium M58_A2018_015]|nr:GAF domain-containing sensor histidine kinase [Synechococcales cyanobacterium M58_A2018_015]